MFYKFKLEKQFTQRIHVRTLIENSRRHDGRQTAPPRKTTTRETTTSYNDKRYNDKRIVE